MDKAEAPPISKGKSDCGWHCSSNIFAHIMGEAETLANKYYLRPPSNVMCVSTS
jgi:hypothetical protein